jgi:hypothetical protein
MKTMKTGIVLLALLLAGMVMVPLVSAEENTINSGELGIAITPHHEISDDYLKDMKPAQWLPESKMITFVLSTKTVAKVDQNPKPNIINLPIEYLNSKTSFSSTKEAPSFFVENNLASDENIILIRMPQEMYQQFTKSAQDGKIALPANYFYRYYENLDDLKSHMKLENDTLKILPSDKYPIENSLAKSNESIKKSLFSALTGNTETRSMTGINSALDETLPHFYIAREHAERTHTDYNYDYCIGQIKPVSWTLLGAGNDDFTIFQEREYKFNSGESIEIVVKHWDRAGSGDLELFPTTWRSGAQFQIPTYEYASYPGPISIPKDNLPFSYGYHVGFASGYYTINFENMDTLTWIGPYSVTSAPGTSSFTDLWGSSEYKRESIPTTNTFEATTVATDEWARIVSDPYFQYAVNVWTPVSPEVDQFVSVIADTNYGRYTTTSHAVYP